MSPEERKAWAEYCRRAADEAKRRGLKIIGYENIAAIGESWDIRWLYERVGKRASQPRAAAPASSPRRVARGALQGQLL